jgi:GNAT superfamily N-acetyltransferase
MADDLYIRHVSDGDREFIRGFITERWGSEVVIVHEEVFHPADLPGFICMLAGEFTGLITYRVDNNACEIVSLDSLVENKGIGTALIEKVALTAASAGCDHLWLVTTNDNLHALGFYQKHGFHLVLIVPDAVTKSRQRKPEIPLIGENGIPITDEIVLTRPI